MLDVSRNHFWCIFAACRYLGQLELALKYSQEAIDAKRTGDAEEVGREHIAILTRLGRHVEAENLQRALKSHTVLHFQDWSTK